MNMDLKFLVIFIFVGLIACQPAVKEDSSKLDLLKKAHTGIPTAETANALIAEYQAIIAADPKDAVTNAQYLHEIAQLQISNKAFTEAIETLTSAIKAYYSAPSTADNVWTIGTIYENQLKRPEVAGIVKKLYAQEFPNAKKSTEAQAFMKQNASELTADIATLGSGMYDEKTHQVNFKAANGFIKVCELYALMKPKDTQSPEYLHKAGETARAIRSFPKAIALYDWIYTDYPTFEKAPQALFLKAFTYDNDLGDKKIAKALYEEFLQKFPADDFADDTEFLLANIEKNDEEIIKSFGQQ